MQPHARLYTAGVALAAAHVALVAWRRSRPAAVAPLELALWLVAALLQLHLLQRLEQEAAYEAGRRRHGCGAGRRWYPHQDPWGVDWALRARASVAANRFLEGLRENLDMAGRTHFHRVPGGGSSMPMVLTDEPTNVRAVLSGGGLGGDWAMTELRRTATGPWLGRHAIFVVDGEAWHASRSMLRPAFVRDAVADLRVVDRHVSNLTQAIVETQGGGGDSTERDPVPVDLGELLGRMTMDSASDFIMGHSTSTLTNGTERDLRFLREFERCGIAVGRTTRLGLLARILPDRERDASYAFTRQYVEEYVQDAIRSYGETGKPEGVKGHVFLPELVKSGASKEYITDQVMSMFFAGRDTTKETISFLFWHLARNPDIMKRLRQEIAQDIGDHGDPSWEQLRNLKLLNWSIKETLRLHPVLPTASRTAVRDTVLPVGAGSDGSEPVFCPKGTDVRWLSWSTQRDARYYGPDPDEFRPDRWDGLRLTWEYIPFSGGPRICIGQQFALTQIALVTVRLLQRFDSIEAADSRPIHVGLGITSHLKSGCWLRMTPRR